MAYIISRNTLQPHNTLYFKKVCINILSFILLPFNYVLNKNSTELIKIPKIWHCIKDMVKIFSSCHKIVFIFGNIF